MNELSQFEAKLCLIQEIQNLQADLRITIFKSKKLAKMKNSDLLSMRDDLKKAEQIHFF